MISHDIVYPQHNNVAEQPQKPLSKKQLSLMSYEPPAQFCHMLVSKTHHKNQHYDFYSLSSTDCDETLSYSSPSSSTSSIRSESSEEPPPPPSDQRRTILNEKSNRRRLDDIMKSIRKITPTHNPSNNNYVRLDDIFTPITKKAAVKINKLSRVNLLKKKSVHQLYITKSRNAIPQTSYYSSNHLMVNRARAMAPGVVLNPLYRSRYLDFLAQAHAADLAENCELQVVPNLESLLLSTSKKEDAVNQNANANAALVVGQNVQRGTSIRQMHESVMNSSGQDSRRSNILRPTFSEFGMATALGRDGKLYMVQLFRGGRYGIVVVNNNDPEDDDDAEQPSNEFEQEGNLKEKEEEEVFYC
jgi:uncharacterized protein YkwD